MSRPPAAAPSTSPAPPRGRVLSNLFTWRWLAPLVLVVVTVIAHSPALRGEFIFDDHPNIVENDTLRLWPLPEEPQTGSRPLVWLTLAANHAVGGLQPLGYHVVNIAVHVLAALVLLALTRRVLRLPAVGLEERSAARVAFAAALLWALHPLTVQCVAYVIQRAESLMALCYLLVLWALVRAEDSPRPGRWHAAAVGACAAGMLAKLVMVTAPVAAVLFDRAFLAPSFREVWRRRLGLHLALAATWIVRLRGITSTFDPEADRRVGFGWHGISPFDYAASQPGVLLHYLRVALWPDSLSLDLAWPVARTAAAILPPLCVMTALFALAAWAFRRRPPLGFVLLFPFLVLGPTSSFVPIKDLAYEHRFYLPLAALVLLVVLGVRSLLLQAAARGGLAAPRLVLVGGLLVTFVAAALGARTWVRSQDFVTERGAWEAVLRVSPHNPRAHNNLAATSLILAGEFELALVHVRRALELDPDYTDARLNAALALNRLERHAEALAELEPIRPLDGRLESLHRHRGQALLGLGRFEEAAVDLQRALDLGATGVATGIDLATALRESGKGEAALAVLASILADRPGETRARLAQSRTHLALGQSDLALASAERAIALAPGDASAANWRVDLLTRMGRGGEAEAALASSVQEGVTNSTTHLLLGRSAEEAGRVAEAEEHYRAAVAEGGTDPTGWLRLGALLRRQGRGDEALAAWQEALRVAPGSVTAHRNVAFDLSQRGDLEGAVQSLEAARALAPKDAVVLRDLGIALARVGRLEAALVPARLAVELAPGDRDARHALAWDLTRVGQPGEALVHLDVLLAADPADAKALALRRTAEAAVER